MDWSVTVWLGYILLTMLAVLALLAVYALVPALLGSWLGIRIERIMLGLRPVVYVYRRGALEWVLGSLPIGAHTKFYGEEGVFGIKPDDWPANRRDDDDDDESDEGEDEEEDSDESPSEPPPPPPEGSFIAAHPLARAAVSLSGPVAMVLLGVGLIAIAGLLDGPQLVLVPRDKLPAPTATAAGVAPWTDPVFSDLLPIRSDLLPESYDADRRRAPLEYPLSAAEGVVKLAAFVAPAEGYSGYLSWAVLLVRSFEVGPAFCVALFGLFACLIGMLNLLPLPLFHGGMALLSVLEWTTGRAPNRRVIAMAALVALLWLVVMVIQIVMVDLSRFG